jgi:hypothetical protein
MLHWIALYEYANQQSGQRSILAGSSPANATFFPIGFPASGCFQFRADVWGLEEGSAHQAQGWTVVCTLAHCGADHCHMVARCAPTAQPKVREALKKVGPMKAA